VAPQLSTGPLETAYPKCPSDLELGHGHGHGIDSLPPLARNDEAAHSLGIAQHDVTVAHPARICQRVYHVESVGCLRKVGQCSSGKSRSTSWRSITRGLLPGSGLLPAWPTEIRHFAFSKSSNQSTSLQNRGGCFLQASPPRLTVGLSSKMMPQPDPNFS
jgi:hypothetical protein